MGMSPDARGGGGGAGKMEEMRRGRVSINGEIFGSLKDTDFAVGSLGGMGDMNDALPLVGSMELGSPLDNFGDMVRPTPVTNDILEVASIICSVFDRYTCSKD